MAAWNTGAFGNDEAADYVRRLQDLDPADVPAALRDALFDVTENEGYLDLGDANPGIAAAVVVAAIVTDPDEAGVAEEAVAGWLSSTDIDLPDDLAELSRRALDRVVARESEWAEVWDDAENGDEARLAVQTAREALEV